MAKRPERKFSSTGFYVSKPNHEDPFADTQRDLTTIDQQATTIKMPEQVIVGFENVQEYLETKNLTPDEVLDFTFWFTKNVNAQINRQQAALARGAEINEIKTDEEIEQEVLVELKEKIAAHILAKEESESEEGERRLIPFLLTKSAAKAKIETSLRNLASKNDDKRQTVLVVANMDLDGLKAINDSYGHLVGDVALKFFGKKLNDALRPGPNAGGIHYSGDEFGIMIEMTYSADLSNEDVNRLVQKRLEFIIAQATAPIISNGPKTPKDRQQEEEEILHLYNKPLDISDNEKDEVLDKHKKNVQKITNNTSQQEVSIGYVIARHDDDTSYEDIQDKADNGANLSKLLPYLKMVKESKTGKKNIKLSPDKRVIAIDSFSDFFKEYSEDEIETAKLMKSLNRTTNELAPDLSDKISNEVRNWFAQEFEEELDDILLPIRLMLASPRILKKFSEARTNKEQKRVLRSMKQIEEIHKELSR